MAKYFVSNEAPHHRPQKYSMTSPEDYFRGVSPLCRRILEDMARTRERYGESWGTFTYEEQCKLLDQAIVDEATVRRYEKANINGLDCEYFPKLKLPTGQKIVSDEKLSARGYSCSWRDEHSAPFSWHTRSQMDLTLDTPPPTPPHSLNSPKDSQLPEEPEHGIKCVIPSAVALKEEKRFKVSPFLWHYDPNPDLSAPDPPEVVVGSSLAKELKRSTSLVTRGTSFNHVVVREEARRRGFLGWVRGAFRVITTSCLPIHNRAGGERHQLHPSSPFIHPELRPPHVIAKAAKVSVAKVKPSLPIRSESLMKDSTLKSECPSTETALTSDVGSARESFPSDEVLGGSTSQSATSRIPLCNRGSLIYGTFEEEEINEEMVLNISKISAEVLQRTTKIAAVTDSADWNKQNVQEVEKTPRSQTSFDADDEYLPLINLTTKSAIPKTGFDFLDNW